MDIETEIPTEQSNDSLPTETYQSSDVVQSENERLRAENEDLKSRLGNLVQKHGQEKKQLEAEYSQWGQNLQAWYEGELNKAKKTIERLEERFLEDGDAEGAKVVLEERRSREREEAQAREARAEEERLRRQEIQDAIEKAVRNFEGVTAEELKDATSAERVWAKASQLFKEKSESAINSRLDEFERRFRESAPQRRDDEDSDDDEVREQEEYSRTPSAPRGTQVPAGNNNRRTQELEARLKELREALEETKRDKRRKSALADTIAIRGEIVHVERQLRQLGAR